MLQMRARAWTLRAGFADVLRGLGIAEETADIVEVIPAASQTPAKPQPKKRTARDALDGFSGAGQIVDAPTEATAAPPDNEGINYDHDGSDSDLRVEANR
jgi:hypothetical protein